MNGNRWILPLGLVVAIGGTLNAERVRGIEFSDSDYELVGWISYGPESPLLQLPFELPSGEVPFDYPARLETRLDKDGKHRVILTFAADSDLKNKNLRLLGWDKNNKSIPGVVSRIRKVPGKDVMLVDAELVSLQKFTNLHRLVLTSKDKK